MDDATGSFGPQRTIDGLAFRETGCGDPLLLLHGGVGSRTHWLRNVAALSIVRTVVTVDLPGFGESATPDPTLSADDYVAWVARALRTRFAACAFDVGAFSFGAAVGCAALRSAALVPRRIALIAPAGFGIDATRRLRLEKLPARDDPAFDAVVARNLGRTMLARTPAAADPVVALQRANVDRVRFDSRRLSMRESLIADLRTIPSRQLWLWGDHDPFPCPSLDARVRLVRERFPDARTIVVPDAGHWLPYDASVAVDASLSSFLSDG